MISASKWAQYGRPDFKPKGVIIHNTNSGLDALGCFNEMQNGDSSRGAHFFVDHRGIVQAMPLNWSCFSSGRGYDFANTELIAIEIVTEPDTRKQQTAEEVAVMLISRLMELYGFNTDSIYFHNDFYASINCPAQLIARYGSKKGFILHYFN